MKKALLLLLGVFVLMSTSFAKKKYNLPGKPAPFTKGTTTIGLGVGFNVDEYDYHASANSLPIFFLSLDHGIINNAGPGNIGIGGILAYTGASYKYYEGSKASWSNYFACVRGTYHLTLLKDKNNKFDPYAGVVAGVRLETYDNTYTHRPESTPFPVVGVFVGAKYNFASAMGVFVEAGYDVSLVRVGLNFNMGGNKGQIKADDQKAKENASKEDKADEDRDNDEKEEADKKAEEKKKDKPAKTKKAKKSKKK